MPIKWWHWFPRRIWRIVGRVEAADQVPRRIPRNGVVLIEPAGQATWLAFDCPCRTGHRLLVNLNRRRRPWWTISAMRPLTVRPSIDHRMERRRCHFFIRNGTIEWAHDREGDE